MVSPWLTLLAGLGVGAAAFALYRQMIALPAAAASTELDYGAEPLATLPALGMAKIEVGPALASSVEKYASSKKKSPKQVYNLAKIFAARGYPMTAVALVENAFYKAKRLGGWPYYIKAGEMPGSLAQRYTGNWRRWTELIGQKVGTTTLKYMKKGTIEGLTPWQPGLRILLPLAWKTTP